MYYVDNDGKRLDSGANKTRKSDGGVYAIEVPTTKRVYVGQSVKVSNRLAQHRVVLRRNKHSIKDLQEDYNKSQPLNEVIVFSCGKDCSPEILLAKETEILRDYIEKGWTPYNKVIVTETTLLNAPKEYLPVLKSVMRALDYGKISPAELIQQLEVLM